MKLVIFVLPLFLISFATSDITRANNLFATSLYKNLVEGDKNEAFSPFSLHTILALTYEGSAGVTENHLKTALTLPSKLDTATSYNALLTKLARKSNVTFDVANKIYAKIGYTFAKSFQEAAVNDFLAETGSVNFENGNAAANEINGWVNTKTNGKIPTLVSGSDFNKYTRAILLNALYFKGKWEAKFNAKETATLPFYVNERETVNCSMMRRLDAFYYSKNNELDAQLLKMKFQDDRFSLIVILPNSRTGITRLEQSLKNINVDELTDRFSVGDVSVSLPRFKIESSYKLKDALSKVGLTDIFDDSAEFPDILNEERTLQVSEVFHKATIEINEEGGEATAASGVVISVPLSSHYVPPPPIAFKADHPFVFLLTADMGQTRFGTFADSIIVLMGKVTRPEIVNQKI
ncbi:hypothetical protein AMK59_1271 [Oryctes borbonicus]|uniref:Serpin domain-containing protein n=1 Tax=Oryctes borbonicus TaxID=1629725 RepID=A0A0T6BH67_9SCAR|nr:hypothetical protein AMK59_1271 [Oryctes borbonicus]